MAEKTAYSAKELKEFKQLIFSKIKNAKEDLAILRAATANDSDNGTEDTSPSLRRLKRGQLPSQKKKMLS
jgi:hypothetical protein